MQGKKITPLRFDAWSMYGQADTRCDFVQPILGFTALKLHESRKKWIAQRATSVTCPICCSDIVEVDREHFGQRGITLTGGIITYSACVACGFWRRRYQESVGIPRFDLASIREFDATKETPSLSHLANEVEKRPDLLYGMDPYRFELFVGSILRDFFDCDVHHVGRTGDDGIDLYAIVKDQPLMIQVKRRTKPDAVEGIDAVKLLFASAYSRGTKNGMVVTTARRFSRPAQNWTKFPVLRDIGFTFELIDFPSLMSMVDCVARAGDPPPWKARKDSAESASVRFRSGDAWIHTGHDTCDVLFRSDAGSGTALVYDHQSLEDCVILTGTESSVKAALCEWATYGTEKECVVASDVMVDVRRNDSMLAEEMCIGKLQWKLSERWVELYPQRVLDITP